ncbi:DoxX family protein [Lentzea jiangxiensis]|uniref:Putative oxidoreductase n=1 Tax=Lentzea jiangxiensis TaxID=641025 RepID=A0A1H0FWI9_9PSEU|nr:DoxX family protein [Lentzea jiangxiensis]SDN98995.1 putative oxidoreductase [Lentzea jiangxiensis]
MATHDKGSTTSSAFSDDSFYSGSGGGVHHFDDSATRAGTDALSPFDSSTKSFDTTAYTPLDKSTVDARDDDVFADGDRRKFGWTAGPDIGLLGLRAVLGGIFLLHGLQKVFGLFGGPGINGFAQSLEKMGYRESVVLAWVTGITELAGGGLLVLGLFTPLAAAGLLAVMANVIALQYKGGFFGPNGVELELALAGMAFAALFAGPGRAALDYNRSWFRHPLAAGFIALLIGAGGAAVTYFVFR